MTIMNTKIVRHMQPDNSLSLYSYILTVAKYHFLRRYYLLFHQYFRKACDTNKPVEQNTYMLVSSLNT